MRKMKLKNWLIFGASAISVFSMIVAMTAVTFIINHQNTTTSHNLLRTSFSIMIDDLSEKQEDLLTNTRKLAEMEDVDAKIKFLIEHKSKINAALTSDTYRKFTSVVYNVGLITNAWKIMVYDVDGDLISFAMITNDGNSFGYVQGFPHPVFEVTSLKPNETLTQESWTEMDDFPGIEATFGKDIPDQEMIRFEQIDRFLCLISYVPVIGWVFNREKEEIESKQLGVAIAVQQLDTSFVSRMSNLTGTKVHIFTRDGLKAGKIAEYNTFDPKTLGESREHWSLSLDALTISEMDINDLGYFQGILPLYVNNSYVGAIAALYSKEVARANTLQMLKMLVLVSLGCIVLIMPLAVVFSNMLTIPICRIIEAGKNIARGELGAVTEQDEGLNLSEKGKVPGEIGALAVAFQDMIGYLQEMARVATHIATGDLSQKVTPWSKGDILGTAFQHMSAYLNDMASVAMNIAGGDLTRTIQERSTADAFGQIIQTMTEGLHKLIVQIRDSAKEITSIGATIRSLTNQDLKIVQEINTASLKMLSTMTEMGDSVESVAHNMDTLTVSVEETSFSVSQMASSIAQIASNTTDLTSQTRQTITTLDEAVKSVEEAVKSTDTSKALSQETIEDAIRGQQAVEQVKSSMETIQQTITTAVDAITRFAQRSQDIDTILNVIREITDQTALLALNASIIAAQAGEHGRGFAVVAGEIKNLADGVGSSTKDIAEIVRSLQQDTNRVVQTIHEGAVNVQQGMERTQQAQDMLYKILDSAKRSSVVVAEIVEILQELKTTSQSVSAAMKRVTIMTDDITRATNEQKSTTGNINTAIRHINEMTMQTQKATADQLVAVREVLNAVTNVTHMIEKNLESSQSIAQTTNDLASEADTLSHSIERFTLKA